MFSKLKRINNTQNSVFGKYWTFPESAAIYSQNVDEGIKIKLVESEKLSIFHNCVSQETKIDINKIL